jgi:hypothetical protein
MRSAGPSIRPIWKLEAALKCPIMQERTLRAAVAAGECVPQNHRTIVSNRDQASRRYPFSGSSVGRVEFRHWGDNNIARARPEVEPE